MESPLFNPNAAHEQGLTRLLRIGVDKAHRIVRHRTI